MSITSGPVARILSADKLIDSPVLNRLGVQVFRALAARLVHNLRRSAVKDARVTALASLDHDGLLVWPDFLPSEIFEQVSRECRESLARAMGLRSRTSGPNTCTKMMVRDINPDDAPALRQFLADERLRDILTAAERRPVGDLSAIAELEHLTQASVDRSPDPQTELHSDIFFTSHKVWFYLSDVNVENGPLTFVRGSHRLAPLRLYHVYRHSCDRRPGVDPSRRIGDNERRVAGDETVLTCRKNTLVVANTCGYHRRLQGVAGNERWSIHLELRANPFAIRS